MRNYKFSHYVIISEPVNLSGKCILFSTRSGKELLVTSAVLTSLQTNILEVIPEPILQKLIDYKFVVPAEEDELLAIVNENKNYISNSTVLYEIIQPSAMCQLGCYYCGQKHTKDYVTTDLQNRIIARIRMKAAAGNYKMLSIGWFGAEPLMGLSQMRALTPHLKEIAKEFGMSYSATVVTNGLSLKENVFEELTQELAVNKIEVTLDGTAEFHDQHRYTKNGGKSFDLIFQNLQSIVKKPNYRDYKCDISIRCNVDEKNDAGVSPLIQQIADAGLKNLVSFYAVGVYSWGNDAHKKSLSKEEFSQRELEWNVEMISLGYNKTKGIPPRKKQVCFTVSKTSEMYDAFGNIYDCSETSYVPAYEKADYKVGKLQKDHENLNLKRSNLNNWNDTLLTDEFPCHTCKMLPVCGGGCPKSWHEDMRACPSAKFNIKDKLLLRYMILKKQQNEISQMEETIKLYPQKKWVKDFKDKIFNKIVELV
ncbi:MAG: radical SAM protein [Emticicia sp.]|uniref:radical SAM protein n=1 Tax=Emticicia sp. TaxID=1930953 RepID=UPI003BA407EF